MGKKKSRIVGSNRPNSDLARARALEPRTSTRQAALSGGGRRGIQTSQLRLASAPKMMGDFFSLPGQTAVVGELFTSGGTTQGLAVYQAMSSGSAFANDNIAIIVTDSMTGKTVFLGDPAD